MQAVMDAPAGAAGSHQSVGLQVAPSALAHSHPMAAQSTAAPAIQPNDQAQIVALHQRLAQPQAQRPLQDGAHAGTAHAQSGMQAAIQTLQTLASDQRESQLQHGHMQSILKHISAYLYP